MLLEIVVTKGHNYLRAISGNTTAVTPINSSLRIWKMASSIGIEKWLVMGSLALISALFGVLPHFILKRVKSRGAVFNNTTYHQVLTFLSCLGGGVLLATTLAHMLPENRTSFEGSQFAMDTFDAHFPLAEIMTMIGFVLIYFLEELAHLIMSSSGAGMTELGHSHHVHSHEKAQGSHDVEKGSSLTYGTGRKRSSILDIHASSRTNVHLQVDSSPPPTPDSSTHSKTELYPHQRTLSIDEESTTPKPSIKLGSFLALIALSFHAVMEGIAIGIQNSTNLWLMFGAIASHKFVISFCMGMELCAAKARLRIFIGSILLFALLSPVGIFIGSFLTSANSTKSFSLSVLEALVTGTLLYVVFFEILSRERERKNTVLVSGRFSGAIQFVAMVTGMVAMVCLLTLVDHGHNTSEEDTTDDHDH